MTPRETKADFFLPLVLVAATALVLMIVSSLALIQRFDHAAEERESAIVEAGVLGRVAEVGRLAIRQIMWDDAVAHLQNQFDPAWAQENIGAYLHTTGGFDVTLVLSPEDRLLMASDQGKTADLTSHADFAAKAAPLIRMVRAAERKRGPLKPSAAPGQTLAAPIQVMGLETLAGRIYVLGATLVQPDFGKTMPRTERAPVVITAMEVNSPFVQAFGQRFLLRNPHLHASDTRFERDEAHVPIRNPTGRQIATLDWTPQTPGTDLARRLVIPRLAATLAVGSLLYFLYRRSRRMAQGLIASEARAAHLAYYDPLTGLPNRVLFSDRLSQALRLAQRGRGKTAVLCMDLDRFKEVNDTFGHHVGDELIQEAARRFAVQCRASDTAARLSGDEFAIVLSDATPARASALAERLVRTMADPVQVATGRLYVGCSIGITLVEGDDLDAAETLRQADLALYRTKQERRGHFSFFEPEMDAAIRNRRAMESDLREALANGDLKMAYQPQVNAQGKITGVEALVRWDHPTLGAVSPAFFVPIAEECGLIIELGMFTLRQAFEDSRRWPQLRVAVNVSAHQFRLRDFVARLTALAKEMGIDPRRFDLEITEGVLLGDDAATQDVLKRLKVLGFSLVLDDFGTGYSSLSYLHRFPISKIKIDRSFVANLDHDANASAVIVAIVKLARAFNLAVIAEGVETSNQLKRLSTAGCFDIQGFIYSRAVPSEAIDDMLSAGALSMHEAA